MKIKMLVGLAGNAYALAPGDERDFADDEAIRLIAAEYAIPVTEVEIEIPERVAPAVERRTKGKRNVVSRSGDSGADQ